MLNYVLKPRNKPYAITLGSIAQENKNAELKLEKILNFFIFKFKKTKIMEHSLARLNFLRIAEFSQICENSEVNKVC